MAIKYVSAKFGNNSNNGNSEKESYLTIGYAMLNAATNDTILVYDGVYFENELSSNNKNLTIKAVGKAIFNGTVFNSLTTYSNTIKDLIFDGFSIINYNDMYVPQNANITFRNCFISNIGLTLGAYNNISFINCVISTNKAFTMPNTLKMQNCTFYGGGIVKPVIYYNTVINNALNNIIFSPLLISLIFVAKIKFQHFYSTPISFSGDALGYVIYDNSAGHTIDDLRARAVAVFQGNASDYFPNCEVFDAGTTPCFVAPELGVEEGFHLDPLSPSATANYLTGKHIGAKPVARGLIFPTGYTVGANIDTVTKTLIDPNNNTPADNTIEYTDWFNHEKVIIVDAWAEGIVDAERNGDIDSLDKDTADVTIGYGGGNLINNEVYVCENESLAISDGVTTINLGVGENQLIAATGTWGITTDNTGVLRQLYTTLRPTINVKVAKNVSEQTGAVWLRFYVKAYDGIIYKNPMVNVDAAGIPTHGDADTGFSYATAIRLQLQYEKRKSIIQTKNAKS